VTPRRCALPAACAIAALLAFASPAPAHDLGTIYSRWKLSGESATVTVDLPWTAIVALDPAHLAALRPETLASDQEAAVIVDVALIDGLGVMVGERGCEPDTPPAPLPAAPDRIARHWSLRCAGSGAKSIVSALGSSRLGALLHLARAEVDGVVDRDGKPLVLEHAFSGGEERWALPGAIATGGADGAAQGGAAASDGESAAGSFVRFVGLGIEHILSGTDHLLFLAGLLLLGGTLGDVVRVVTGFTLAHSLTLVAGVLGVVRPPPQAIEALIGLSIVVVALEYFHQQALAGTRRAIDGVLGAAVLLLALARLRGLSTVPAGALLGVGGFGIALLELAAGSPSPGRWRWAVAFAFGLVHGFAFAGTLLALDLPRAAIAGALFGFNLGVEIGQLLIIGMALGLVAALRPWLTGTVRTWLCDLAAAGVLASGCFWFVARTIARG